MTETSNSPRTLRSDIVFTFALALACYLAWLIREVLVLLYVSALFGVVLTPLVRSTSGFRVGRFQPFKGTAIFLLLLIAAGALAAFGFLALPPVIRDLQGFARRCQHGCPDCREAEQSSHGSTPGYRDISSRLQVSSARPPPIFCSLSATGGQAIRFSHGLHPYYLFHSGRRPRLPLVSFLFPARTPRAPRQSSAAGGDSHGQMAACQGSLMLILGVTSTIVYLSLHIRYAYALGVLTGLLNIVPVLGAAVCIALALLVEPLTHGPGAGHCYLLRDLSTG